MLKNHNLKNFIWHGTNEHGEKVIGEIESINLTTAKVALRNKKILVKKIKQQRSALFNYSKKIKSKDITLFTRQLATMLSSGIPLIQSFSIIAKGYSNSTMVKLINKIKVDVESGHNFSQALQIHPFLFNQLYCNLVHTGEQVGALDKLLDRLATYKEQIESLKTKLRKALIYPAAIFTVAIIVTLIMLICVIPQFQLLFTGFGATLPSLTLKIISLSSIVSNYWWAILGGITAIVGYINFLYKYRPWFREFIEKISLKLPLFGALFMKAAVAKFARTLATMFSAGIPIVECLESVSTATGNYIFETATKKIREQISQGQSLHQAIQNTQCFPEMTIQIIRIGEETGKLGHMLTKIADYYEEEIETAIETISTLIEPIMVFILGIIIGGLVIGMYLPIFKMGTVI